MKLKLKKKKIIVSLVIIVFIFILFTIFGEKLSTNNPTLVNNLKNLSTSLSNSIFNESITKASDYIGVDISNILNFSENNVNTSNNTLFENTTNLPNISAELYKVIRVVDGDTIIIDYNGKEERVRLIGIDTPESVHPNAEKNSEFGKKASNFTKQNLTDKSVGIEFDVQERDKYGRLLAYIYLNDIMYNKTLLAEGYAKIATYPPNVKYVTDFTIIQEEARNNKKGLWGLE